MSELQTSQFPEYNSKLFFSKSSKSYQNSNTELRVEWGPYLSDRIRLMHNSKMDIKLEKETVQMINENNLVVEATPLKINYGFKLNSNVSMYKSAYKLVNIVLVGRDVDGRPGRDIRASFKFELLGPPIHQMINASLSYSGREMSYYSEVKQIEGLTFAAKTYISPQKGELLTIDQKARFYFLINCLLDFRRDQGGLHYTP